MSAYDVVYVVRGGDDNPELRYSLRSLAAHVPHGTVWLAGHCPPWVKGVRHLFVPQQPGAKYANVTAILRAVAERGPDEFLLFNDDFFATEPVLGPPPIGHRGGLIALADSRARLGGTGAYARMLRDTAALFVEAGYPDPLAYTLHVPMHMRRDALAMALDYGTRHLGRPLGPPALSWRSIYGNLLRLGGQWQADVKVHADGPIPPGPWLSTSDTSFRYHPVGKRLRRTFSTPCRHEVVSRESAVGTRPGTPA